MDREKIGAVILAAGRSSRQNGFKPLLPLGPKTAIRHCMDLFFQSGLSRINVVVGHRADEIFPVVISAGARPVLNPAYDHGMFSSVQAGVGALPENISAFFVLPADIPLVRKTTIDYLIVSLQKNPGIDIFLPEFHGRTGHPPLVRSDLRGAIACHDGQKGLRGVFDKCLTDRVPVPDRYILEDIDTPGQYNKVLDLLKHRNLPEPEEAEILLDLECRENPEVARHCRAVAMVAEKLAEAINKTAEAPVDKNLVTAAALLHDIAKGQRDHCSAGAGRLRQLGFSDAIADIVAFHADYKPAAGEPVNEIELVYLADKLVSGTEIVTLDTRFKNKYEQFRHNPQAKQAVMTKWVQALKICKRFETASGCRIEDLL